MNSDVLAQYRSLIGSSFGGFLPEAVLGLTVCACLLFDLFGRPTWRRSTWIAGIGLGLALVLLLLQRGEAPRDLFGWQDADAHRGMLRHDGFAWFFKLLVAGCTLLVFPMARRHRDLERRPLGEFYALLLGSALGMFLMVSATNLLMAYLAIEFASMGSYLLTAFVKRDRLASEAGLKYVLYGSVASGVMIFGMSLLYGMTGSLWFGDLGAAASASEAPHFGLLVAGVFVFAGFAYKMAAAPMHFWCPDVYQGASTPITAWLSVASKAAGFGLFVRFTVAFGDGFRLDLAAPAGLAGALGTFGWFDFVAVIAALSMTIGNLAALGQENVKRMLAYSSIAHAGYLLMGVCALQHPDASGPAFQALIFYFVTYFAMNLGAFYVVNLVGYREGTEELGAFRGLGKRAPWLAFCLALFAVSLIGIPPTGGFTGKFMLLRAVLLEPGLAWLAVVAVLNTAISVYYYAKLLRAMYLDPIEDEPQPLGASPWGRALSGAFAVAVVVLGVLFNAVADWAGRFEL